MGKYNLGIDIGGTFIKYALVDKNYKIVEKWKVKSTRFNCKDKLYDYICNNIKSLELIDFIGVSAPGVIDDESNVKSYAAESVSIMYGTNINHEINIRTNKKVASINDAKSAGLCELKIGNAKNTKSSAFLILGTGTGGCICDENGIINGKDGYAGEFHHFPFMNMKTKSIDKMGDYASITGLINIHNEKVSDKEKVTYGREICEKYLQGDKIAKESINDWTDNILVSIMNITAFYNPEIICIGGGISEEDWFINLIKEKYISYCKEYIYNGADNFITTIIDRCKYNNDANILGAIINVINS